MSNLMEQQLQSLAGLLRQREVGLRAALESETGRMRDEPYADLAGDVRDEGDEAVADVIVDTENAMVGRHLAELRDIEAAHARLSDARYGICCDCGEDTGFLRLATYPTAKRCALCQHRHEHTYAEAPHSSL
jgi:DnaK suppressor protein